jgi:hypothetical protein
VTRADDIVEKGSDRLQQLSEQAAAREGVTAKLAEPLSEDAAFLRKLKPSLIKARARGEAPTDEQPEAAPSPAASRERGPRGQSARNPLPLVGAALAAGVVLARILDWRGHGHPRA